MAPAQETGTVVVATALQTVAIDLLLEDQVTVLVRFWVTGACEKVPMTVSWSLCSGKGTDGELGLMASESKGSAAGPETVSVAVVVTTLATGFEGVVTFV